MFQKGHRECFCPLPPGPDVMESYRQPMVQTIHPCQRPRQPPVPTSSSVMKPAGTISSKFGGEIQEWPQREKQDHNELKEEIRHR